MAAAIDRATPSVTEHDLAEMKSRAEAIVREVARHGDLVEPDGIEVAGVDSDRIVQVRMLGSCRGCAASTAAVTTALEQEIRARLPEIRFVEAVL